MPARADGGGEVQEQKAQRDADSEFSSTAMVDEPGLFHDRFLRNEFRPDIIGTLR
jgi:hypothetical protein